MRSGVRVPPPLLSSPYREFEYRLECYGVTCRFSCRTAPPHNPPSGPSILWRQPGLGSRLQSSSLYNRHINPRFDMRIFNSSLLSVTALSLGLFCAPLTSNATQPYHASLATAKTAEPTRSNAKPADPPSSEPQEFVAQHLKKKFGNRPLTLTPQILVRSDDDSTKSATPKLRDAKTNAKLQKILGGKIEPMTDAVKCSGAPNTCTLKDGRGVVELSDAKCVGDVCTVETMTCTATKSKTYPLSFAGTRYTVVKTKGKWSVRSESIVYHSQD